MQITKFLKKPAQLTHQIDLHVLLLYEIFAEASNTI